MADAASDKIKVRCEACGARFKAPAAKAGVRGPCPKCGEILTIPQLPAAAPAGDVDWSMLSDAAAPAGAAEHDYTLADAGPDEPRTMVKGASSVLAGLTPAQREALARRAEQRAQPVYRQPIDGDDQVWGIPSFLGGLALATAGALIGAAIWFALLAGTGRELRFLAILVGTLAGGGMAIGYQKHDMGAGVIAACLAVGAILLAKFAVVWWGTPYLMQAQARIEISEEEKRIDEEYSRVPPELAYAATWEWNMKEYCFESGMNPEDIYGSIDYIRDRHLFPLYDKREAATPEQRMELLHRWDLYERSIDKRLAMVELEWEQEQADKAAAEATAEAGEGEGAAPATLPADAAAADAGSADSGPWNWSPEKQEAMAVLMAEADRKLFEEVKALDAEAVREEFEANRELERRQAKLAARARGAKIAEQFDADGLPVAMQQKAAKYLVFSFSDLFLLPLALAVAWRVGAGFGD